MADIDWFDWGDDPVGASETGAGQSGYGSQAEADRDKAMAGLAAENVRLERTLDERRKQVAQLQDKLRRLEAQLAETDVVGLRRERARLERENEELRGKLLSREAPDLDWRGVLDDALEKGFGPLARNAVASKVLREWLVGRVKKVPSYKQLGMYMPKLGFDRMGGPNNGRWFGRVGGRQVSATIYYRRGAALLEAIRFPGRNEVDVDRLFDYVGLRPYPRRRPAPQKDGLDGEQELDIEGSPMPWD